MFFLRNLSSSEVFSGVKPWEFTRFDLVPEECLADKKARDEWVNRPTTDYHVYTLFEGVQQNLRLHAASASQDENPPLLMHGLAVDYDAPTTIEDVHKGMKLMGDNQPNWFEQTLSGHGRLLWMFQEPLRLPSRKFAIAVLKGIKEICHYDKLVGLDEGALFTPDRYFTNGARWTKLSPHPVPAAVLRGFAMRIAGKFDWLAPEFGKPAASLEAIAEECRKRFPRFSEWPGEFTIGAQGPSFWVQGSESPKSAIVRETGMHTFSGHAHKPFFSWSELVGEEFVVRSEDEMVGKAVESTFFDGKTYFLPGPDGSIRAVGADVLRRHLTVMRGLSDRKLKGAPSTLDKALGFIEAHNYIDGAASCAFYPKGVFNFNGKRLLNTHRIEALKPAKDAATWGPEGNFPFVSTFLDTAFSPVEPQRDRFLAWLQLFYKSCLERQPRSGHGVFIAGPVGTGKNFLADGIVGSMVGGYAEANSYLTAKDNFNSDLFDHALWTMHDGSVTSNQTMHRLFSENVKRAVANREHRVNEKFRKAVSTPWQGRIFVTCNDDPISISVIPNLDISILEKLMLFRFGSKTVKFLSQPEMEKLLARELPNFARWLLDWTPPSHCFDGAEVRFGVASYCEESLARTANQSSAISSFAEILTRWLREYFQTQDQSAAFWQGSATDLRISMSGDPAYAELLRTFKTDTFGKMLLQLHGKQIFKIDFVETQDGRLFKIHREARFSKPLGDLTPQAQGSKFEKQ